MTVSVLLPTFNRARFLPAAFDAIRAQTLRNWELILVDDGSTDETAEVVARACRSMPQRVRYVTQANAGPYAARNAALDLASGEYIAFYDSDDLWLPHHLERCAAALDRHADIDWVYAACRVVDLSSGAVTIPNTFRADGAPRRFMVLPAEIRGDLHVLRGGDIASCALLHGLYCGLQNSVIRRRVFEPARFHTAYRNEAEDQLFAIRALKNGHRFAFLDDVHVQYHVHESNSSGSAAGPASLERQVKLFEPVARGFEALRREVDLSPAEDRALRRRLNREYFWHLGYSAYWTHGRRKEAMGMFRQGLDQWPWSLRCWKTYIAAGLRAGIRASG